MRKIYSQREVHKAFSNGVLVGMAWACFVAAFIAILVAG